MRIEITGKYATAIIYTDDVEQEALDQIQLFVNSKAVENAKIRIMPDVHKGAGCVIGYTSTLTDRIVPNVIGVDIGCGVIAWNLGKTEPDFELVEQAIRNGIPHGFLVREEVYPDLASVFKKFDLTGTGIADFEDFLSHLSNIPERYEGQYDRFLLSLGSLGGGNHFIEINKDESGTYWLVIHSGSRSFGLHIANHHQDVAVELVRPKVGNEKPDISKIIADAKARGEHSQIQGLIDEAKSIIALHDWKPSGIEYLEGDYKEAYFREMKLAQVFAALNRRVMGKIILDALQIDFFTCEFIESVHNYIDFQDNIIRKGAISAHKDQLLLVPLNMRDGTILASGKGNPEWNYSAAHGAGRQMSRNQAMKNVDLDTFRKEMEGIWTTSVSEATIDESPWAYKDANSIIQNLNEAIDIISVMKPVYNFKSDMKSNKY